MHMCGNIYTYICIFISRRVYIGTNMVIVKSTKMWRSHTILSFHHHQPPLLARHTLVDVPPFPLVFFACAIRDAGVDPDFFTL